MDFHDSPVFWQLEFWHRALSAYGIPAMEFWHIEFWQWNFDIQYFGNAYNLAYQDENTDDTIIGVSSCTQ